MVEVNVYTSPCVHPYDSFPFKAFHGCFELNPGTAEQDLFLFQYLKLIFSPELDLAHLPLAIGIYRWDCEFHVLPDLGYQEGIIHKFERTLFPDDEVLWLVVHLLVMDVLALCQFLLRGIKQELLLALLVIHDPDLVIN